MKILKKYTELDILRGFAIIGVLLIHITSDFNNSNSSLELFFNQASRFAVPVFLFISGLGLTLSEKLDEGYIKFLLKRISKIIPLYLLWSIIYYIVSYETYSITDFLTGFVLGHYYHLYYVPLIIFLYLVYPILKQCAKNFLGLLIVLFITILSHVADIVTGAEIFNNSLNIFNWLFYFVFGIWFAHNFEDKIKKLREKKYSLLLLFLFMLIVVYSEAYFFIENYGMVLVTTAMRPSVIFFSVSFIVFIISLRWENKYVIKSIMTLFSKHSYGIYLSHALNLKIIQFIYNKLDISLSSLSYVLVSLIFVSLLSIFITVIMNKLIVVFSSNFLNIKDRVYLYYTELKNSL